MSKETQNTELSINEALHIGVVGRSSYSFRAWNNVTGKMMQWSDIKRFGNLTKLISLRHVHIMQEVNFQGLFEGDIVKDHIGIGVVVFSPLKHSHIVKYKDGKCKYFTDYLEKERKSIEILGNVFQHGDLF